MNWKETHYSKFKKGDEVKLIKPCRSGCRTCTKIIREKAIGKIDFEYSDIPNKFYVKFDYDYFDCKKAQLKRI